MVIVYYLFKIKISYIFLLVKIVLFIVYGVCGIVLVLVLVFVDNLLCVMDNVI